MSARNPIGLSYIDLVAGTFLMLFVLYFVEGGQTGITSQPQEGFRIFEISLSEDDRDTLGAAVSGLQIIGSLTVDGATSHSTSPDSSIDFIWVSTLGRLQCLVFDPDITFWQLTFGLPNYPTGSGAPAVVNFDIIVSGEGYEESVALKPEGYYTARLSL